MAINRLSQYNFAISQSISGSFNTGDTVEASFLAKGNSSVANNYVTQFVDIKYSVSSESISLQEFPKGTFPEQFFIGQSYTTQSFTAGIPEEIQYVEFTLTGSLNGTGSNTYNSGGAANYQRNLELDYDAFQVKVHTPKTELTDSGLLVFTSPSKFIKANSDGIEIKGGNIEAEKITARELEVLGNTTIFGDITATANSPYNDTPQNISTDGSAGSSALFARGDHIHNLPFATLNAVIQEGELTKISGSSTSTGSFGTIEIPDSGRITIGDAVDFKIFHDGSGNSVIREDGSGELFLQGNKIRIRSNSDGSTLALFTDGAGTELRHGSVKKFETSDSGINVTGHITASGNISSSQTGIFNKLEIHGADGTLAADYIIHKDDDNTKFGFPSNDHFKIRTAGTDRYVVDTTHTFTGDITTDSDISASGKITGDDFEFNLPTDNSRKFKGFENNGVRLKSTSGGWAMSYGFLGTGGLDLGGFGGHGSTGLTKFFIGGRYDNPLVSFFSGSVDTSDDGVIIGRFDTSTAAPEMLTVEGNISASGNLRISSILDADDAGASSTLSVDAQGTINIGPTQVDEINIGRQAGTNVDINFYASSSTPSMKIVNQTIKLNHPLTSSANISSSGTQHYLGGKLSIGNTGTTTTEGALQAGGDIYGKKIDAQYSELKRFGGLYFTWDSDSYGTNIFHSIRSTEDNTYTDSLTFNSFDKMMFNLDSNDNNNNSYFRISHHGTGSSDGPRILNLDDESNFTLYRSGSSSAGAGIINFEVDGITGDISSSGDLSVTNITASRIGRDDDNSINFGTDDEMVFRINKNSELKLNATTLRPFADDGLSLGTADDSFSDLFLADGAVIDFNSELAIQQSNKQLLFSGMDGTKFVGHITASGNISASGTIFASKFESDGASGEVIDFNDNLKITGNITASGNISASGTQHIFGGNVGIGTTPAAVLHISSSSGSSVIPLEVNGGWQGKNIAVFERTHGSSTSYVAINAAGSDPQLRFNDGDKDFSIGVDDGLNAFVIASGSSVDGGAALAVDINKNVGIGTTSPTATLDVRTDGGTGPNIFVTGSNSGHIFDAKINNDQRFRIDNSGNINFSVGASSAKVWNTGAGGLSLSSNSTEKDFFIKNDGKVGIGTTSPGSPLEVIGNISSSATGKFNKVGIGTSPSNNVELDVRGDALIAGKNIYFAHDGGDPGSNNDFIRFSDSSWLSAGGVLSLHADQARNVGSGSVNMALFADGIYSSGKVGIGTTSPIADLDIRDGHIKVGEQNIYSSNVDQPYLIVADDDHYTGETTNWGTYGMQHRIKVDSGGVPRLTIDSLHGELFSVVHGGHIGIGTNNPTYTLDVDGGTDEIIASFVSTDNKAGIQIADNDTTNYISSEGGKLSLGANNGVNANQINIDTSVSPHRVGIGTSSPSERLDVSGNIKTNGNISSPTFESGFAGSGFRVTSGSKYSLEVDDLTVRNSMSVFELLIHQVRATNGSLFVSNTAKLSGSAQTDNYSDSHREFQLFFDTGSGYGHSFQVGDLIRAQRFVPSTNGSGSSVFKSDFHLTSVNATGSAIGVLSGSMDAPQPGYEYVRIGNSGVEDRQGSIYMTADDGNAPFIDVVDNITAHSDFNTSGKVKTRIGKLDGITTSTFGTLDTYGFYASGSAYLEGSINATAGEIGGFTINSTSISASNLFMKSSGQITGSDVLFDGGTIGGYTIDETSLSSGTNIIISSSGIIKAGGGITIDGNTNSGQIQVSNRVQLNGNTTSTIGGFTIDTNEFRSGDFKLNTDVETLQLGTVTDFAIDGSDKGLFVSGTGDFFIGKEDKDFIHFDASSGNLEISSSNIKIEVEDLHITASDIDMTTTEFNLNANSGDLLLDSANRQISLANGNIVLDGDSNSNAGHILVGTLTGPGDTTSERTGLYAVGDGRILLKASSSNYIKLNNDNVEIKSTNVDISGSSVNVQTPSFFFGSSTNNISSSNDDLSITTKNLTASGSSVEFQTPNFFLGTTTNNISSSNNDLSITTKDLTASGSSVKILTPNFFLGSTTNNISSSNDDLTITTKNLTASGSNVNILTNNFFLGSATNNISSSNDDLSITTKNLTASGSSVDIQTPSFFLGNQSKFISGSGNDIEISSSGFHLKRDGSAVLSGSITANAGTIGGFTITDKLTSGVFKVNPTNSSIKLGTKEDIADDGGAGEDTGIFMTPNAFVIGPQKYDVTDGGYSGFRVLESGIMTASKAKIMGDSEIAGFKVTDSHISASGLILKSGGQITASAVDLSGKVTATSGKIGDWTITEDKIKNDYTSTGSILLDASVGRLEARETGGTGIYASLGNTYEPIANLIRNTNEMGLCVVDLNGSTAPPKMLLRIDNKEKVIAGWEFDYQKIISSGSNAKNEGVEIHSTRGIFGHGDSSTKETISHAGMFKFTEDTLSAPGGSNGNSYDITNGEIETYGGASGGNDSIPEYDPGGTE